MRMRPNGKMILVVTVAAFAIWNLGWFIITKAVYSEFLEAVPKNEFGKYVMEEKGYLFNVKKPGYLSFTGNLGVTEKGSMNGLIIWPEIFGGYKYGVRLQQDDEVYEIYLDEHMKLVNEDEFTNQLYEKYQKEIESLFSEANQVWDLD